MADGTLELPGLPIKLRREGTPSGQAPETAAGAVRLRAAPRSDLFVDPLGRPPQLDAERFVGTVSGNFQFSARVEVDFRSTFDAGVLLCWIDDHNWFKLCAELDPAGTPRVVSVVTRGHSDDANAWPVTGAAVFLRLSRMEAAYALHASADGIRWELVRQFSLPGPAGRQVEVGLMAQSPTGDGAAATFSDVKLTAVRLRALRDGS